MLPSKQFEISVDENLRKKTLIAVTIKTYNISASGELMPPCLIESSLIESHDIQDEENIKQKSNEIIEKVKECLINQ